MDPLANMLTIIVNAQKVGKERVAVEYSSFKEELAKLLQSKHVVSKVRVQEGPKSKIIITLAYDDGDPKITSAARLSKPGSRHYIKHKKLPYTGGRPGLFVVSTSQGLMDQNEARSKNLGGELLCVIWQ